MNNLRANIGANLALFRKMNHLTQQQVANEWGIKREQYSKYERGVVELNYSQIVYLCNRFDISPNDLFGWQV